MSFPTLAKITLQVALIVAVIVLWTALQAAQADYRLLAEYCQGPAPQVQFTPFAR